MFNNLIESSSHAREFKRRGSFILFTSVTYVLLFTIAGILSIYAYDARMEDQNMEIITMLNPLDVVTTQPAPTVRHSPLSKGDNSKQKNIEREVAMVSVNHPEIAPETTSVKPNTNPPIPDHGSYKITGRNFDPGIPGGPGNSMTGGGTATSAGTSALAIEPPPAAPLQKSVPKLISKRVINSEALSLPKPPYPSLAKQTRTQGVVSVQVLIDESGKVISAKTISGHPLLAAAAQRAAYEARFSPTMLGDHPVKVSGVITYNFVLQ